MEMSLLGQEGVGHPCAHVETLMMSRKERDRLRLMAGARKKKRGQASTLLGLAPAPAHVVSSRLKNYRPCVTRKIMAFVLESCTSATPPKFGNKPSGPSLIVPSTNRVSFAKRALNGRSPFIVLSP